MQRIVFTALLAGALGTGSAQAQLLPFFPNPTQQYPTRYDARYQAPAPQAPLAPRGQYGGGLFEALFGDLGGQSHARRSYAPAEPQYASIDPAHQEGQRYEMNPIYRRQVVNYDGGEKPGTIIIDTPKRFLYLVQEDGRALRYGIGVGRPGFTWAGVKTVSAKREWPDWRPPDEMLRRRPDLPRYMAGGPDNPLGARAMYLGTSLYRIHGSNEPWTIGTQVSSGCIRMRNEDVIDLYGRVKVGTKVVVI
jgi:lipoprotein-anchoring transpeptidase ErfK/SrfK